MAKCAKHQISRNQSMKHSKKVGYRLHHWRVLCGLTILYEKDDATCRNHIGQDLLNPMWKPAFGIQGVELGITLVQCAVHCTPKLLFYRDHWFCPSKRTLPFQIDIFMIHTR